MKTLLLVDGSSYLYRAFHALPDLRNTKGEPTGAIYGVINMLRRLQKDTSAEYLACIFDAKGRTFRDEVYAQYKANRTPMPDELGVQLTPLKKTIEAMGWPLLEVEGVEADDVIGTLTAQAEQAGLRVVISTGDKDMAQLVSSRTSLVNTMSNETLDEGGVEKKFGTKPERFIDYLTLVGDSIDNVPGVEKVGPKTAVKWLAQYGSLEGVIDHAGEVGGMVGDNLRKVVEWLPQAREILTIKRDVPLPAPIDDLKPRQPDVAKLTELFDRFEFKTWRRELESQGQMAEYGLGSGKAGDPAARSSAAHSMSPATPSAPELLARTVGECEYETVLTEEQLSNWLIKLEGAELAALGVEGTSLDSMKARLVGLSFSIEPACAAYVPVGHRYAGAPEQLPTERVPALLRPWLADPAHAKVGQDAKYR